MKKLMLILTVVAFLATLSSPALAQRGWGGNRGPGYGGDFTNAPGLNLTAEQKTKIDALRDAFLKDVKPLQDKLFSKRGDMKLLWLERTPDQAKIAGAQKEVQALRDQMQDKALKHRFAVLNTLTPEQQDILRSCGAMGRGFGPAMGRHGGGMGRGTGMGMMGY
jgi:Spy/CpxP family protein refolding chaperone